MGNNIKIIFRLKKKDIINNLSNNLDYPYTFTIKGGKCKIYYNICSYKYFRMV